MSTFPAHGIRELLTCHISFWVAKQPKNVTKRCAFTLLLVGNKALPWIHDTEYDVKAPCTIQPVTVCYIWYRHSLILLKLKKIIKLVSDKIPYFSDKWMRKIVGVKSRSPHVRIETWNKLFLVVKSWSVLRILWITGNMIDF